MSPQKLITTIASCAMVALANADTRHRTPKSFSGRASKTTICHWAKSDATWATITVGDRSLDYHFAHGDCVIDDEIDCTVDACDPEVGCTHTPDDAACDDGNKCTGDTCDPALGCVYVSPPCSDGIDCTDDACDPATGACVSTPNDSLCDDGVECTRDVCDVDVGGCTNTLDDTACDDGDDCTSDYCDASTDCTHDPITPCCGDGTCSPSESDDTGTYCAEDCCGNGVCDPAELQSVDNYCSADCNGSAGVPVGDVRIDAYIQIDDLDLTGPGGVDANLCSLSSTLNPLSIVCGGLYQSPDNPTFPGPDPANPDVLGPQEDYVDWADVLSITPGQEWPRLLLDLDVNGVDDDIFVVGSCIGTGYPPTKANLRFLGIVGNDDYLYMMAQRQTTNGSEKHHFIFSRFAPTLGTEDGCIEPTWLWDMREGDILVELDFEGTTTSNDAAASVWRWSAPDADDVPAGDLLAAANWVALPASSSPPVYLAYNAAYDPTTSPNQDDEKDIYGNLLASGQLAELALDRGQVFGETFFNRTLSVISTASASPTGGSDLKDFQGPVTILIGGY